MDSELFSSVCSEQSQDLPPPSHTTRKSRGSTRVPNSRCQAEHNMKTRLNNKNIRCIDLLQFGQQITNTDIIIFHSV